MENSHYQRETISPTQDTPPNPVSLGHRLRVPIVLLTVGFVVGILVTTRLHRHKIEVK